MRGKVKKVSTTIRAIRITPAYAGKSGISDKLLSSWQDHPRLCGEKMQLVVNAYNVIGSPPPMRGKGVWELSLAQVYRITPAYAGKRPT